MKQWPGLFSVIGYAGFKCIGYSFILAAGALAGAHVTFWGALACLALGHGAVCMAEAIREVELEDSFHEKDTPES